MEKLTKVNLRMGKSKGRGLRGIKMGICIMAGSGTARETAKEQLKRKMAIDMKGNGTKIIFMGKK